MRVAEIVTERAQPPGVDRRPVDERIRGRIQGGGTGRGVGPQQARRTLWRESGRPGEPDARNDRQRRHGRSGRTGHKERTLFVRKRAFPSGEKGFFAAVIPNKLSREDIESLSSDATEMYLMLLGSWHRAQQRPVKGIKIRPPVVE